MGGENRSIARAAFESRLPDSILHRRTKGGPDGFLQRLVERNRSKIKDMLLGGHLAAANIIDRSAVDAAIKLEGDRHNHMHFRILELVDAEAWVAAMKAS
jgi:asparagine synthase (glutamine-hydrolysing)